MPAAFDINAAQTHFLKPARSLLSHPDRAVEYSALFDQQDRRNHVPVYTTSPANFKLRSGDEVAAKFTMNHAHSDIDLRVKLARLADYKSAALRCQLAV